MQCLVHSPEIPTPNAQLPFSTKPEGVQRDVLEAERRLVQATSKDSPLAWHNLGSLYFGQHPELKEKWGEGRKCWERAKELGFDCAEPYPPWDPESPSPD
jgi:hypothetical protein